MSERLQPGQGNQGRRRRTARPGARQDNASKGSARTRRQRELACLNAVAEALNRTEDLGEALTRILTLVAGDLGLRAGWVWLADERGEFVPAATYQLPPHLQDPRNMTGWHCLCLRTFLAGDLRGAANVNVLECSRLQGVVDGTDGLRFHASIPIYLGGRKLGVMNVAGPKWRELTPEELQFLYTIGYQVGLAVEHSRLLEARTRLAQVEERNRIAREIHDTVAQGLAGLTLQLDAADALLARDSLRGRVAVQHAMAVAQAALEEVRRSVLDLRAAPLDGLTLWVALPRLVEDFGRAHGVTVRYHAAGPARPLSPRLELGVYRVTQEALANAAKHGEPKMLQVTLQVQASGEANETLRLMVEDDGRGFDPSEPVSGHYGLLGMRERARILGGSLHVASTLGAGTTVVLEIPLMESTRAGFGLRR